MLLGVVGIGNALIDVGGFTLLARLADETRPRAHVRGLRGDPHARGRGRRPASRRWSSSCSASASPSSRSGCSRRWPWPRAGPRCAGSMRGCACATRTSRSCARSACWVRSRRRRSSSSAAGSSTPSFAPGQTVFEQGERGECFYVVESGRAEVVLDGRVVKTLGRRRLLRRDRAAARPAANGHRARVRGRAPARERAAAQRVPDRRDRLPGRRGRGRGPRRRAGSRPTPSGSRPWATSADARPARVPVGTRTGRRASERGAGVVPDVAGEDVRVLAARRRAPVAATCGY